jgi:predicted amidophosphoribosyltransferase
MTYDEPPDDEDWYDEDGDETEETSSACPECGEDVYDLAEQCAACGYWLSDADRRSDRSRQSKPQWVRLVAILMLIVFLFSLVLVVG